MNLNKQLTDYAKALNVLYVEDEPTVRENTKQILLEFFNDVYVANDGQEGLDLYQNIQKSESDVALVITDISMPNMDGITLIEEIKKINKSQLFLIISSYNDSNYLSKSIELGVEGYIFKPFTYQQLLQGIEKVVEKIKLKNELLIYQNQLHEAIIEKSKRVQTVEEENKSKSLFLASMSHEIRTPLTAIMGYVDLLKKPITPQEKDEYIKVIDESSKTLLMIVNDILDLSKIEAGKLELYRYHFSLHHELELLHQLYSAKTDEKSIRFIVNVDEKTPKFLFSDPLRIKQIVSNLLSNAIKFTHEDGEIRLNVKYENDNLIVSVKDNGIGLTAEQQDNIFCEYGQATIDTAQKYGGTGLGLSIILKLVRLFGGEIKVISEFGYGAEFIFNIPAQIGDPTKVEVIQPNENVKFSGNVLVAEDNKTNQKLIKLLLEDVNLNVDIVCNGYECYEKYKNGDYEIILMDVNMPEMDGLGATRMIRAFEHDNKISPIPIISLSANARKEDIDKYKKIGMNDYIAKPIQVIKMHKVLKKYLNYEVIESEKKKVVNNDPIKSLNISQEEYAEMFDEFIDIAKYEIDILKNALSNGDSDSLYKSAHLVKGSAYLLGQYELGDLLSNIEKKGRENNLDGIEQMIGEVEERLFSLTSSN